MRRLLHRPLSALFSRYGFTNLRFQRLFIKNTAVVFLGILVPVLISVMAVYIYSRQSLLRQTDMANARSLENTCATVDMILGDTASLLYSNASNRDVLNFMQARRDQHNDFYFYEKANTLLNTLRASLRASLDTAISLYSEVNDYVLSTFLGGQNRSHYTDQQLCSIYNEMKAANPQQNIFCVLRKIYYLNDVSQPQWTLVVYNTIPQVGAQRGSFITVDINLNQFSNYLTGNTRSDKGSIYLIDREGQILFDSTGARISESAETLFSDPSQAGVLYNQTHGALSVKLDGVNQRLSWVTAQWEDWKCVQLVPMDDYTVGMTQLRNFLMIAVVFSMLFSVAAAYLVSLKLFRPVQAILEIVENPNAYNGTSDQSGEIQYLLMNVLSSFQRNITLEEEMVQKMAALRNARTKALQEQMTPHFLYNALQAINWLALSETNMEDSRTSRSIITLAEISRTCMEQSGNYTTVAEEIDYVRKFMEIEQLRYGDTVRCHYDIDPAAERRTILRISLQPLVENAISHGIQLHACEGNIYIRIRVMPSGMLQVRVEDDGVGVTAEQLDQLTAACSTEYVYANQHVGLVNLSQRIKLAYGEDYQLFLGNSMYGGLLVEFSVPEVDLARPSDMDHR